MTGSITIDNSGIPTIENPPPNAPFMKQIRNTPAKVTRIVVTVSSMTPPPSLVRAGARVGSIAAAKVIDPSSAWPESVMRP